MDESINEDLWFSLQYIIHSLIDELTSAFSGFINLKLKIWILVSIQLLISYFLILKRKSEVEVRVRY